MLASYRLLSERSRVRLAPGARSNSTTVQPNRTACVANRSAKRAVRNVKSLITIGAFTATAMVLTTQPAPFDTEANAAPANEPTWTAQIADRFPACERHVEGTVAAAVIVVHQNADVRRMSVDAAFAVNTDDERANNVWVIGTCA